jgi:hypothetical protein
MTPLMLFDERQNDRNVSADTAGTFLCDVLGFSRGRVVFDQPASSGVEIGRPETTIRPIQVNSIFGKLLTLVTDCITSHIHTGEATGMKWTISPKRGWTRVKVLVPPVRFQDS